jgi:HAD superfamily hydrolase (TIGR01509 family)
MRNYLFDFDGTLVDSMPTYVSSMLRILDENGVKYGDDIVKIITPLGLGGAADYYITLGIKMSREEILGKMLAYMTEAYENSIMAKPHVIEAIRELHARGDRLHVLTASPHSSLDPCLKRLGIYDLFENVWSCEDFFTTKADPKIYEMAAERIGAPIGEILFLDDNLNADVTAKRAGMKVCGVYDESSAEYTEEIKKNTDFYINDFSILPDIKF